jgi:hypothetical protein
MVFTFLGCLAKVKILYIWSLCLIFEITNSEKLFRKPFPKLCSVCLDWFSSVCSTCQVITGFRKISQRILEFSKEASRNFLFILSPKKGSKNCENHQHSFKITALWRDVNTLRAELLLCISG